MGNNDVAAISRDVSLSHGVANSCYTEPVRRSRSNLRRGAAERSHKQGAPVPVELLGGSRIASIPSNSTVVGAVAELLVASDLMSRGHQVFRNMAPSGIDLIAQIGGSLYRVEVCMGKAGAGASIAHPTKPEHYRFDIIAAVLPDHSIHYFWKPTKTP